MLHEELKKRDVLSEQILSYKFDSLQYEDIDTGLKLYKEIEKCLIPGQRTYLFLDEVQEVKDWEKAVNSFMTDFDVDIYVTGSNSRMMSSEISTYLTGRYVSFRFSILGYDENAVASMLENLICMELLRRGYEVFVGKLDNKEVDFVATRKEEKIYIQILERIEKSETEQREYGNLLSIVDNYPKYVLRTDEFAGGNYEGIKTMHLADFLLSQEY